MLTLASIIGLAWAIKPTPRNFNRILSQLKAESQPFDTEIEHERVTNTIVLDRAGSMSAIKRRASSDVLRQSSFRVSLGSDEIDMRNDSSRTESPVATVTPPEMSLPPQSPQDLEAIVYPRTPIPAAHIRDPMTGICLTLISDSIWFQIKAKVVEY
eukprot:jgi/Hompol1/3645/HPOL_000277-RA